VLHIEAVARTWTIRTFRPSDAEEAAELLFALAPANVRTAAWLRDRQLCEPDRARRRSWVAVGSDKLVAYATAYRRWYGGASDTGRIEIWVHPDFRRRGIGTELWETAVAHLGVGRLTVEVDDDPDGLAFAESRGLTQFDSEVISRLEPLGADLAQTSLTGFSVLTLDEVRHRERELFEFYAAAGGLEPGDPENRVRFEEWHRFILGNPLLDDQGSVVVADDEDRIVSLSWLLVDHERRRAENEWTATLPQLRGRGLARVAKSATIRWAAEQGLAEILTGNDPDNEPMRKLNRSLGYRELYTRLDLERRQTISGMPDTDEV
jgi:GNAT superfamily N-acetyltransferase